MRHTSFVCTALISIIVLAVASIDLSPTLAERGGRSAGESMLEARLLALEADVATLGGTVAGLQAGQAALEGDVATLEGTVADLLAAQGTLQYMTVDENPINGMPGPHIIIEGANLHIRSGEGQTVTSLTGRGNVVIGYNEPPPGGLLGGERDGTHNLIIGPEHKYSNSGCFLAGRHNTASGPASSVSGGRNNTASSRSASVSGGDGNTASGLGQGCSVSGGKDNTASGWYTSVSGGKDNTASSSNTSVSGGLSRTALSDYNWRAGSLLEGF